MDKLTILKRWPRAQTMAEYALIMAAVAVVVFAAYQAMGTTISKAIFGVDAML